MQDRMSEILAEAKKQLEGLSEQGLLELRARYLGKKGEVTALLKNMGSLSPEERPEYGKKVNALRESLEAAFAGKQEELVKARMGEQMQSEKVDVTLPGKATPLGAAHPLTQVYGEIKSIFLSMGFEVAEGPEIEWDKYNFEMLNIPKDHPARDMQDTFYVSGDVVLRTHTSPVQVRTMLSRKPPIRVICPGRVYRTDDIDATHSPVFHQMEGLYIDKGVTFADLKGVLSTFLKKLYGEATKTRFRPGFFPFTEPSAEVDATCGLCKGKGCPACKGAGLVELMGCGMVNPVVLENCGIDSTVYSGFAFGMGLDRITNIRYGITDIRHLFENDVRFLEQFI